MEQSPDLVNRVRDALFGVPDVVEKRMFGSLGFMVRGKLCIGARPERLMVRIDPSLHDEAVAQIGCSTVVMKGREYNGYVHVDGMTLLSNAALGEWITLALAYNRVLLESDA